MVINFDNQTSATFFRLNAKIVDYGENLGNFAREVVLSSF